MRVITDFQDFFPLSENGVLTIGNFDGLHLGHDSIFQKMKEEKGEMIVLTFSNHPSTILSKTARPSLLDLPHKLHLLEKKGIDTVLLIPFTKELSLKSADEFLAYLREKVPFKRLVLGHDATIGHKREGDEKVLRPLSQKWGFKLDYLSPFQVDNVVISSSVIRELVSLGELKKIPPFLGREYSIFGKVIRGNAMGAKIGFQTLNIAVDGLCLPPLGVWGISANVKDTIYRGVANLGVAPTIRNDKTPLLEIHLFDFQKDLYDQEIEVIFRVFLRKEMKFESVEALKTQIVKDISQAKELT